MNGLIGKKIGMTSIYDTNGRYVACTVIQISPNVVTQVKSDETDGYKALQLAAFDKKEKHTTKQELGHFAKASTTPKRKIVEFRNPSLEKALGETLAITDVINEGDKVKIEGTSKGKGFQGVVKRHNFGGVGQSTHGQHNRLRAPGSIGACTYPAKVFKGVRMAGQTGNKKVTVANLKVEKIITEHNIVLLKGAVPGHKGSYIIIKK